MQQVEVRARQWGGRDAGRARGVYLTADNLFQNLFPASENYYTFFCYYCYVSVVSFFVGREWILEYILWDHNVFRAGLGRRI